MKYVDEFRDPAKARTLIREIERLVGQIETCRKRPLQLMEVCGGHTHSIFKYGLETMVPGEIEFVHGPGCPVCVLPVKRMASTREMPCVNACWRRSVDVSTRIFGPPSTSR